MKNKTIGIDDIFGVIMYSIFIGMIPGLLMILSSVLQIIVNLIKKFNEWFFNFLNSSTTHYLIYLGIILIIGIFIYKNRNKN